MFYKKLTALFFPALLEAVSIVFISMMNTVMVSHLGEIAINAVNLGQTPLSLVSAIMVGFCTGITIKVSQFFGKGSITDAKESAENGIFPIFLACAFLCLLMILFHRPILSFLFHGIDAETLSLSAVFFVFASLSLPFWLFYYACISTLRGAGEFKLIFWMELLINSLYLLLGLFFIHVLQLGVWGLGLALLLCRMICAFLIYRLLRSGNCRIYIDSVFHKPNFTFVKPVLALGTPTALNNLVINGGGTILQTLIVTFGAHAVTANALVNTILAFFRIPASTMMVVTVTMVAQVFGSGDFKTTRNYMRNCVLVSFSLSLILCVSGFFFLNPLIGLYTKVPETVTLIRNILLLMLLTEPLNSFSSIGSSSLRAVGDIKFTTVWSITLLALRIMGSYLLSATTTLGIYAVFLMAIAEYLLGGIIFTARRFSSRWERLDRI